MNWSDPTLMAFADGELDAAQRAEVERALAGDAALRERVAALQAQRARLAAAFAPVLAEPLPQRLSSLLTSAATPAPGTAQVIDLEARRMERGRMPSWAQWGGMAASLLVGVLLGVQFTRDGSGASIGVRNGQVVAGGEVEQALSTQLASAPVAGAAVAVQLSFIDKAGAYCRTFSTATVAGLACRRDSRWVVQHLAAAEAESAGAMRQAATALPRAVLDAVDRQMAGDALDPARERQARDAGWQR